MSVPMDKFKKILVDARGKINSLKKEIDEVSVGFNSVYENQFMEKYDNLLETCAHLFLEDMERVDEKHREAFKNALEKKKEELNKKAAELKKHLKKAEGEQEEIEKERKQLQEKLRNKNPCLDAREEKQKEAVANLQDEIKAQKEKLKATESGMNSLANIFKIRRERLDLNKKIQKLRQQMEKLKGIREAWEDLKSSVADEESELQHRWEKNVLLISQLKQDLSYIENNFDRAAELEAARDYLSDRNTDFTMNGRPEFEQLLKQNDQKYAYQEGLKSVAEVMGTLTGLETGLDNFLSTVDDLKQQEDQYSAYLPRLSLDVPGDIDRIIRAVVNLTREIVDEKKMISDPQSFSRAVSEKVERDFNDESMERLFKQLGASIEKATKVWK